MNSLILSRGHRFSFINPCHFWILIGQVRSRLVTSSCRWDVWRIDLCFSKDALVSCLPFSLLFLIKWSFSISAEKISMEILPVSFSWINGSNFATWSSKRHEFRLSSSITPRTWHQQIKIGILLNTHGSKCIIAQKLIKGYLRLSLEYLVVRVKILIKIALDLFFRSFTCFYIWVISSWEIFLNCLEW